MFRLGHLFVCTALLALAGCTDGPLPDSKPEAFAAEPGNPVRGLFSGLTTPRSEEAQREVREAPVPAPLARVHLAAGKIVVAGPEGYCVDPATLQSTPMRGFAVIASCRILSGGKLGNPVAPMLVTVTVGPSGSAIDQPDAQALAQGSQAVLLDGSQRDGLTLAHLATGGTAVLSDGDTRHWRGAFTQGGRLIGLALYAPKGSALAGPAGGDMLGQVHAKILAENGGPDALTGQVKTKPAGGGLLGRLFDR